MRFKARFINIDAFLISPELLQSIQKISKTAVVVFSEEQVQVIVTNLASDIQVWNGVPQQKIFSSYNVSSLNNNQIGFEVHLENITRALKSAQYSQECMCKLTKKGGNPYLTFLIEIHSNQSAASHVTNVTQDVPVKLYSPSQLQQLVEPALPDPTVHILLPQLQILLNIVERMKNVGPNLNLSANMDGRLTLSVSTEETKVDVVFTDLDHPEIANQPAVERDPTITASGKVDAKKFARFLACHVLRPENVVCCIVEGRAVVTHVLLDGMYLTYYIPVIASAEI